jgi:hypothetical protein
VSLSAASFQLTPREVEEAVRTGKQSLIQAEFGREWQVADSAGGEVTVQTPFYRLALLARHQAFKGEEPSRSDISKLILASEGRLNFWVALRGDKPDFAKSYQPMLLVEGKEVKPVFVQNERTALAQGDGRFLARCLYSFPVVVLTPRATFSLVVRTFQGQEVNRFSINLATMR